MNSEWLRLTLAILATWRLAHLLAFEDGPWDVVVHLRCLAGDTMVGRLMDCPYCLTLWIAAPVALSLDTTMLGWILAWLGVSGGASLTERLSSRSVQPTLRESEFSDQQQENSDVWQSVSVFENARTISISRLKESVDDQKETSDVQLWEPSRRGAARANNVRPVDRTDERPLGVPRAE